MQRCPHCQQTLEDGLLPICWHCGRTIEGGPGTPASPTAPLNATTDQPPSLDDSPLFALDHLVGQLGLDPGDPVAETPPLTIDPEAPFPTIAVQEEAAVLPLPPIPAPMPATKPGAWAGRLPALPGLTALPALAGRMPDLKRYRIPILALGGVGAIALTLSVMGRPQSVPAEIASAPPPAPAPATPASTPAPAPKPATPPASTTPAPVSSPAPAPKPVSKPAPAPAAPARPAEVADVVVDKAPGWVIPRRTGFATDGSRTLTLELTALRDLQIAREHIRPVLAVRCLSRRTEVFVALGTSAAIEAGDTNGVTVQIDDQPPSKQQWLRTDSYRELFAPDGAALARQFVGASLLRFTFTPFRSRPVVAEFSVKGFDQHVATLTKPCGWQAGTAARR